MSPSQNRTSDRPLLVVRPHRDAGELAALAAATTSIGHSFGNLMSVYQSVTELVERAAGADAHTEIEELHTATERGVRFVRRLLELGRQDGPDDAPSSELREGVEAVVAAACRQRPDLTVEQAVTTGSLHGSSTVPHVVLAALLANAVEAAPEGGTVSVRLSAGPAPATDHVPPTGPGRPPPGTKPTEPPGAMEAPWLHLDVHDEGPGMDAATAARAFEPFFTTKREAFGAGLGLVIADLAVRGLGGTMWVTTREGGGTTASALVPARAPGGPTMAARSERSVPDRRTGAARRAPVAQRVTRG